MWPLVLSFACATRPVSGLVDASALSLEQDQLPVCSLAQEALVEEHLEAEGWVKSRGGKVGTEYHRVRRGETAQSIAHDHGQMPLWVIETYNPATDLTALQPGQQLLLPLLADSVVAHPDL
jgi:hypothetical protein